MLNTFIVGGGRVGLGLHRPVLRKLRARPGESGPWSPDPPVVRDLRGILEQAPSEGLVAAGSPAHAAEPADPATTVVHVCTPPVDRCATLRTRYVRIMSYPDAGLYRAQAGGPERAGAAPC